MAEKYEPRHKKGTIPYGKLLWRDRTARHRKVP